MKRDTLDRLRAARRERRPVALVTDLESGAQSLTEFASERTGIAVTEAGEVFTLAFVPTPRLIVVGAVHIAQRLTPIARLAGFAVSVVDPREAFATAERFPGLTVVQRWPDRALEALAPDAATASRSSTIRR